MGDATDAIGRVSAVDAAMGFARIAAAFHDAAYSFAQFARAVNVTRNHVRLRRQLIAKARGRNWRLVR